MVKVEYVKSKSVDYLFKNVETGEMYKWCTSKKNHYGIYEGHTYYITFQETQQIENEAKKIKYVRLYEKLDNGEIIEKKNRRGTYKEWS